ncbi:MAG TPA: aminotransferase class I/II-fold pyridoxal phosphate-dependent enzyme, partial [Candidatus Cloacimonadota bacterium]|nr:aminotransferase class I/II-fold pyridoxal phosphate-dependent enzyme [Candidatus Cloacimonadota bacterium]
MTYDFDTPINRKGSGCFKYDALKMIYGYDDLVPLWVADMDFAVAPAIQEAMQKRLNHPVFGYNLRLPGYYEAIMEWTSTRYNWTTKREWIVSPPGVVPALCLAILSLTQPGDGILIQPPVYNPFHTSVTDHGRNLLYNHLVPGPRGWEIDFEDFEKQARLAKLFILCNPHNPTGRVFTKAELLKLGEICKRHNVLIFSDEIHADIIYPGSSHIAISSM